ncbi:transmembrane protein 2 [Bat paramyxovirus]|uniref:Transmembrane protein 2 n=1 Tax=bat paramyxovirus 16797 TaxID=3070194 RepID=A0AA48FZ78_9MONO|nr:transmembrane protein 2 [Bat paramyxovirus]AYM47533.1 transmembrane protein 2 [bat paramyxovirus 16797]
MKCSWSPFTIEGERKMNNPELKDYELRANHSIEQIKSIYGDFDDVRENIRELFEKITIYFFENVNKTESMIQLNSYLNNTFENISLIIERNHKAILTKVVRLTIDKIKMRNKLIDLYVKNRNKAIRFNKINKNGSLSTNRAAGNQHNRTISGEGKVKKAKTKKHRSQKNTKRPSLAVTPPPPKRSRRSTEWKEESPNQRFAPFQGIKSLRSAEDLIKILNRERFEGYSSKNRFDPLYTHLNPTKETLESRYADVQNMLLQHMNGSGIGSFYKLGEAKKQLKIQDLARSRLKRMKRFVFIPNLAAYKLPLHDYKSPPNSRDTAKYSSKGHFKIQSKMYESSKVRDELTQRLDQLESMNTKLLSGTDSTDHYISFLRDCYTGTIPGYKLIHCPTKI